LLGQARGLARMESRPRRGQVEPTRKVVATRFHGRFAAAIVVLSS